MNRKLRNLTYTVPGILIGAVAATNCNKVAQGIPGADDICGPCGDITKGDVGISGDARLDGFFNALGTLNASTTAIKADFDANVSALASIYGVDASGGVTAAIVDQVIGKIKADVSANASGG